MHAMRFTTWRSLKWPSSCASTASTSAGASRVSSVSKKTMRLARAEAGEVRVAMAERRLPSITNRPRPRSRSAPAAPRRARAQRPSASGENLLNSGAITRRVEHQRRGLKAIQAPQAQSHHSAPAARMIHRTSAASGRPSAAATSDALGEVGEPEPRVIRLKPKRASMPNVVPIARTAARRRPAITATAASSASS